MSVVALVGTSGAPGATTLACMLGAVWPSGRPVIVAECDPSGGDIAARFGLSTEAGMSSLVVARRSHEGAEDASGWDRHLQLLPGGLGVLVGPVGGDAGAAVDKELASARLILPSTDVIADCGRLDVHAVGQQRVVRESDRVVLVARSEASAIAHGRWTADRISGIRGGDVDGLGLVVTGRSGFKASDVAGAIGVEMLGILPWDPAGAAMLGGQPGSRRALARTPLVVTGRRLVSALSAGPEATEWRDAS